MDTTLKLNVDADKVAINGYDPVSYFEGRPLQGAASISSTHEGAIYRFANEHNKARFEKAPMDFAPQYGGWCAVATSEGVYFESDPENYIVDDGKLYLFYNGDQGNTKPQWEKDPTSHREAADKHWSEGDMSDPE